MKVFDNNVPAPLPFRLPGHQVTAARQMGWQELKNGDLLTAAETGGFEVFVTSIRTKPISTILRCHSPNGGPAFAFAFLVVIPAGNLRLLLPFFLSFPQEICCSRRRNTLSSRPEAQSAGAERSAGGSRRDYSYGKTFIRRIHLQFDVDFHEVHVVQYHWLDFTIADSAIVLGACLLLLEALRSNIGTRDSLAAH